jgi:cell fate regulator YaaT (PSP1 superfamily)
LKGALILTEVVGVRFKALGKIYYFDPEEYSILSGTDVIVETARGLEYGKAVLGNRDVDEKKVVFPLRRVVRVATEEDQEKMVAAKSKEDMARSVCLEKIAYRQLPMKLVDVEYSFDGSKVLFYFTSEGRVDFRELVKDLASVFKTRIELRQIGVRDEAKMIGGLGACGRELCCASFLSDFEPVSIRMAKEQNLSLNPSKISGICGRLMCCLKYESEGYECIKKTKGSSQRDRQAQESDEPFADEDLDEELLDSDIDGDLVHAQYLDDDLGEYPHQRDARAQTKERKP